MKALSFGLRSSMRARQSRVSSTGEISRSRSDVLDEIELANTKIHGYGSLNFGRNLRQCYQHLAERDVRQEDLGTVMSFAERILDCPMEVIGGVPETLEYLAHIPFGKM